MSRCVFLVIAGLIAAGSAQAAPRLSLDQQVLEGGSQIFRYPDRRLKIRHGIAPARAQPIDDVVRAPMAVARRSRGYSLTGDFHPFANAFRVSLGLREDDNRRLLRMSADGSEIGTARYAPLLTIGVAGAIADGIVVGADVGLVGHSLTSSRDSVLVTPNDLTSDGGRDAKGYRPVIQFSAGYRF